jgi:O-phospho-L-seryl-tRNASec:L-selenocysteinyl-tRNA synthase
MDLDVQTQVRAAAEELHERHLHSPDNPISLAITVDSLRDAGNKQQAASATNDPTSNPAGAGGSERITMLGSMLWQRCVSGARVVARGKDQKVAGILFQGYGSSCNAYPHDYMTAAAAIGASERDVDLCIARLKKCWQELRRKQYQPASRTGIV